MSKSKKITFHSADTMLDILRPMPSSKFVPEWFRTMLGIKEKIETVKKCVPFLDSLTSGYMIPLKADVFWSSEAKKFSSQSSISVNSDHYATQIDAVYLPPEYDPQPHKWMNDWFIKTPKGYSTLFVHPLNRTDLPFMSFSGVVDTDKHPIIINFPFVLRKDFDGIIPAGTPVIQAIPFKRDDWDAKILDTGEPHFYAKSFEVNDAPFGWYKRKWWQRKLYR